MRPRIKWERHVLLSKSDMSGVAVKKQPDASFWALNWFPPNCYTSRELSFLLTAVLLRRCEGLSGHISNDVRIGYRVPTFASVNGKKAINPVWKKLG